MTSLLLVEYKNSTLVWGRGQTPKNGDKMGFWRKLWWYLAVPIGEETDEDDD